jgi:hypothetical protein
MANQNKKVMCFRLNMKIQIWHVTMGSVFILGSRGLVLLDPIDPKDEDTTVP